MSNRADNFREIVLRHLGPPVNIEGIIRSLGVSVDKKAKLDKEISGQIERLENQQYKISVNSKDHYFRQRFTLAHELGHYLLHSHLIGQGLDDDKAYRSVPDGKFYNQNIGSREETEANSFAARLLMPKSKLMIEARPGREISDLAKAFQVSPAAMKIRLTVLGIEHDEEYVVATP